MISIEYRRSALKDIGKLEKSIKKEFIQEIEKIKEQPSSGSPLKGDLRRTIRLTRRQVSGPGQAGG